MSDIIIPRVKYQNDILKFKDKNIIKVITGQRRTGKSCLLMLLQNNFKRADKNINIIYINKELYKYDFIRNYSALVENVRKNLKSKVKNYLFIDEIQEIDKFEKALIDFFNIKNLDIYISGSNARMLSGELATFISGRYIEFKLNPLSFIEFLEFHNLGNNEDSLYLYLRYGGMPYLKNLNLEDEIVFPYLKSIFDTIILKDVVARFNIRNIEFLLRLVDYITENTGNLISAKKISDYLKSQKINMPPNTIINYLHYLTGTYFLNKVPRFDIKGKKIFEINDKFYFTDIGLRNCITGYRQTDIPGIIENAVYTHLKFLGYDIKIGYLNSKEIDFVGMKENNRVYVQACYLLDSKKVIAREFNNLLEVNDNYDKFVVSLDRGAGGNIKGVKHLHLKDFLSLEKLS